MDEGVLGIAEQSDWAKRAEPDPAQAPPLRVQDLFLDVPGRRLLAGVDFDVECGEFVAVIGPSGSGKTSLLNCISGISVPTQGSVLIDGTEIGALGTEQRAALRLSRIGIAFQFGELLPELSVLENVALPLRLQKVNAVEAEQLARQRLDQLGLAELAAAHPDTLSGGQTQRVGLARALVHNPILLLADEPTGMVDEANTVAITKLLSNAAREQGVAVLVATHDPIVARVADRTLLLSKRRLTSVDPSQG
ncbi:ABC transporter ATP-binding protein [Micromonospora sp. NPDC023633]|uniref:ABC transporter ATP-binding protein n=1 Tax=Micromonospora sp. NPDC023633 TaxID=3154320 RepID=UPI0033E41BBF